MDTFDRESLRDLATTDDRVCVSIFMPTNRADAEHGQNRIRLKNLVREARQHLKQIGHDEHSEALLKPAQAWIERESWGELSDGVAGFLTPDSAQFYRVPLDLDPLVFVGERFHLKPLFPLLAGNNRFYVLALSKNSVRLFQGSHEALSEVQTDEIPSSIVEALYYDDPERSIQSHTGNRSAGRHDTIYHGQGVQDEDKRRRPHDALHRFFNDIDRGVRETLQDEVAPLLLAGVEHYLPIYREVNSYAHLVASDIVGGNADHLSPHELHKRAWAHIEPHFQTAQTEAISHFKELAAQDGLASQDVKEIIPAAFFSRVDTLFVPIGKHLWGHYDPDTNAVQIHETREAGDDDLFDVAAVQTFLNGGTVHALRPENMPAEATLAATFRYPASVEAVEE